SRAQKPSKSVLASFHIASNAPMPEMRAALTVASLGGNTRFSTRTDSMALMLVSGRYGICRNCPPRHLHPTDLRTPAESTPAAAETTIARTLDKTSLHAQQSTRHPFV